MAFDSLEVRSGEISSSTANGGVVRRKTPEAERLVDKVLFCR